MGVIKIRKYFIKLLWGSNELNTGTLSEQCLTHSKCQVSDIITESFKHNISALCHIRCIWGYGVHKLKKELTKGGQKCCIDSIYLLYISDKPDALFHDLVIVIGEPSSIFWVSVMKWESSANWVRMVHAHRHFTCPDHLTSSAQQTSTVNGAGTLSLGRSSTLCRART